MFKKRQRKLLDSVKTSTYKMKFIESFRFMSSSLSNLVDNISDGVHNIKCTDSLSSMYINQIRRIIKI